MNTKDVTRTLQSLGWSTHVDEVGDKSVQFNLPDRNVKILYKVRRIRENQKLSVDMSLSTDIFSKICSEIDGGGYDGGPLVVSWNGPKVYTPVLEKKHVAQLADEAIAWARERDLDKAIREYAALPTNAPGARPIWHLAALVILGELDKLKSYKASFEAGDRLGFVPYIDQGYIDRAVALAEQEATHS